MASLGFIKTRSPYPVQLLTKKNKKKTLKIKKQTLELEAKDDSTLWVLTTKCNNLYWQEPISSFGIITDLKKA